MRNKYSVNEYKARMELCVLMLVYMSAQVVCVCVCVCETDGCQLASDRENKLGL